MEKRLSKLEDLLNESRAILPNHPRPIVILAAGGIVKDAHLPAYKKAGLPVIAIADRAGSRASELAGVFQVPNAFSDLREAIQVAPPDAVFDLAVPANAQLECLAMLPDGAAVLLQKPMGETLEEAKAILDLCRAKHLTAAVNFQLRWAPNMLYAQRLYQAGKLGTLHDFELQVSVSMPWELWTFLEHAPRLEILYHSIHYLDLARAWLGDPVGVYAKTVRSPRTPGLAATKSVVTLDYSNGYGPEMQRSFVQIEGTEAAVHAQIGVNLNYPQGLPDTLSFGVEGQGWNELPISGNWFPDAFIGSMASLQCFIEGSSSVLPTSVEDAIKTMALVEAAYTSSEQGGIPIKL
jgi:predicted dehydrogenase